MKNLLWWAGFLKFSKYNKIKSQCTADKTDLTWHNSYLDCFLGLFSFLLPDEDLLWANTPLARPWAQPPAVEKSSSTSSSSDLASSSVLAFAGIWKWKKVWDHRTFKLQFHWYQKIIHTIELSHLHTNIRRQKSSSSVHQSKGLKSCSLTTKDSYKSLIVLMITHWLEIHYDNNAVFVIIFYCSSCSASCCPSFLEPWEHT